MEAKPGQVGLKFERENPGSGSSLKRYDEVGERTFDPDVSVSDRPHTQNAQPPANQPLSGQPKQGSFHNYLHVID